MAGNDQNTELTPKQELLIEALLAGHNITLAAKVSGVADKTARRWLKLPHFKAAYKAAQKQVFDQALQGLMFKVEKAIHTLDRSMDSEDAPPGVQVRAAQLILEQAINVHKAEELEQRVIHLEERLKLYE